MSKMQGHKRSLSGHIKSTEERIISINLKLNSNNAKNTGNILTNHIKVINEKEIENSNGMKCKKTSSSKLTSSNMSKSNITKSLINCQKNNNSKVEFKTFSPKERTDHLSTQDFK